MLTENPPPSGPPDANLMERDAPQPGEARAALVKRWLDDIATARKHWEPDFKRMRRNMRFAGGKQWLGQTHNDQRYKVNLVQRVLKVAVSSLYAKNPTVVYKRRPKMDFKLWDGSLETLQQAQQAIATAQQAEADPAALGAAQPQQIANLQMMVQAAQALIQDVQQGVAQRQMIEKVGKTLVACTHYYLEEGQPGFKLQMKQMVRRARTTGVGYVKIGFQREMDLSERQTTEIADMAERLAVIGRLTADIADGKADPNSAEAEELRLAMATMQAQPERIVREGLLFSFPHSTRIIPSIGTQKLMGWVGSEWIAEEIMLTPDRIKEVYGVDVGQSFTAYKTIIGSPEGGETRRTADRTKGLACVYHVYDKSTGMELVVCEGYPDFLKEPGEPEVFVERFFPVFAITFNDTEEEGRLFPDSDVENMTSIQMEFNRAKEAMRQHRIANRPLYIAPKGAFEEAEVKALSTYAAHSVIELNGIEKGRPATDLLAPVQKIGVDPNLYETGSMFEDLQRVTGNSEANLGGTSSSTATESSIAESSRQGTVGLDGDDLDDMLTDLFRAAGQVLLTNLTADTAMQIAGVGAAWPTLTRQDVMAELWLEVKAGSSGRPNAAADAAKFERLYPLLVQVPGITPRWLAEKAVTLADDNVDLEEAITEGLQSITAMNQMAQPATGNPETEPTAQGGQGASNGAKPGPGGDNGQPGFTAGPQK